MCQDKVHRAQAFAHCPQALKGRLSASAMDAKGHDKMLVCEDLGLERVVFFQFQLST